MTFFTAIFASIFMFLSFHSTLLQLSEDTGIESKTVATLALAFRRSNNSARAHLPIINPPPPPPTPSRFIQVYVQSPYF
jgi:hypothetical protein